MARRASAAAVLLLAGLGVVWLLRSAAPSDPHLLLVTFDTTRADHLRAYGYRHGETPALDRLARHGVRYERCYSPAPLTLPAHASLMTGLYPPAHGLRGNGRGVLAPEAVTLAEVLRHRGYRTAAFVGARVLASEYGLDQGFQVYDDALPLDPELHRYRYAERDAAAVTDAALAWLDREPGSAPLFLWTHYFDPHMPYEAADRDGAGAVLAPYDAEIAWADAQLDRLLLRLGEIKRRSGREVVVVFAADHGEALWDHGEPSHGYFAYSETLRVPLIVFRDAAEERGAVVEEPVSLVDVFPTVLGWLGLDLPYPVDGRPLPAAGGPSPEPRPIYFESRLPLHSYGWSPLEGVVLGHHKLVAAPRPELYDLAADPGETRNLYAPGDPRATTLGAALRELRRRWAGPRWTPGAPPVDAESLRLLRELGYLGQPLAPGDSRRETDPKDRIHLHRSVITAKVEIAEGAFRQAFERLAAVLAEDEDNPRALLLLLDLAAAGELDAELIGLLEERAGRPLAPPFARLVPLQLGLLHAGAGRTREAELALRRALAADPADPAASFELGRLLRAGGDGRDEGLGLLRRAHESEPANLRFASEFARAAEEHGDLEAALAASERALESHPDDPLALNNGAWFQLRLGDAEGALERARRAATLRPDEAQFRHTHASVLLRLGREREALAELRAAVEQAGASGRPPPAWLPAARAELARLEGS